MTAVEIGSRNVGAVRPIAIAQVPATVVAVVAHARSVAAPEREAFAARLEELPRADGLVVIHTCQRVEVYVAPGSYDERMLPDPPRGAVRLSDADAATHLVTVACGFDSAVLGEDQILHQLRETQAARHAAGPLDPVLDRLLQAALHAGRAAHSWFGGGSRSLSDVAVEQIAEAAGSLEGRNVLVVGVGTMGRLAALAAARKGARVLVANRTAERAVQLAREVGGIAVSSARDGLLPPLAGVVVAIRAEWNVPAVEAERLASGDALVVDLSTPSAVPEPLRTTLGTRFVTVDLLARDARQEVPDRLRRRLEALVSETGREYCRWLRARASVPAILAVARAAEAQRADEMEWLLRRLPELSEEERQLVEQMTHRLVAGILHRPLAALGDDDSGRLERAARDLFRI